MSVDFNWQVEAEDDWAVFPEPSQKRSLPWRFLTLVLILILLGGGIAAGLFWQRVYRGAERLKRELRAAANLEAQAIRQGDFQTFLSLQDQDDQGWYSRQEQRVELSTAGAIWGAHREPGQEAELAIVGAGWLPAPDRTWAELAWAWEDGIYRRVQFYRQDDGHWLRGGARREYFGNQRSRQTEHFVFKYLTRDEPTVDWMAGQLESWYAAMCADLVCAPDAPINVLLTPDDESGADYRPPHGFSLTSPRLRGVRQDGALMPEEQRELAWMLAYTLIARGGQVSRSPLQTPLNLRVGDLRSLPSLSGTTWLRVDPATPVLSGPIIGFVEPERQPYLLLQFANWAVRRLGLAGDETPPTPVLDAVMAAHGIAGIQALHAAMPQTDTEDAALRQALGVGLEGLNVDRGQYLAALLALERQTTEWKAAALVGPTAGPLARRHFNALLANNSGSWYAQKQAAFQAWPSLTSSYDPAAPLAQPVVQSWEQLDEDVSWAEVSYTDLAGGRYRRVEFFREIEGVWRHTLPLGRYLGDMTTLTSEHFVIVCYEREVDFMLRELVLLEARYRQLAASLGDSLPAGERVRIQITNLNTLGPVGQQTVDAYMVSPFLSTRRDEPGGSYLWSAASRVLLERADIVPAGAQAPPDGNRAIWWDITLGMWQLWLTEDTSLFEGPFAQYWLGSQYWGSLLSAMQLDSLPTFSELGWLFEAGSLPAYTPPEGWEQDKAELAYLEAVLIVAYAGEQYGPQVYPALLQTLAGAESLADWLETALDVDAATFEADWRTWLREKIGP
ncbi:MAG: hypothetical protein ACOYZ7_02525 [Chloroflexota bacterium]